MKRIEAHKHFILGENRQWFPDEEFIVHLAEPRCFIRFDTSVSMLASFEEFFEAVANVQWIDGKPSEFEIKETLMNAWNFFSIEEEILEEDEKALGDEI
ncbi:MAG: hypothetical protein ACI9FN_000240 [Saprospiraceae bacterium]|jgi:hypothetical protein